MKTIDDVKLKDTLPESIATDKKVSAIAEAIDPHLQFIASKVDVPSLYSNIDNLSSLALDHLAAQYDVTVWRDSWPVNLKRSILKTALPDKRIKGTRAAIEKAVSSLGSAVTVVPWWQQTPKGQPYTFKVYATLPKMEGTVDTEMQEDLLALIDDAKSFRDSYDFILQTNVDGGVGVYGCFRTLTVARI